MGFLYRMRMCVSVSIEWPMQPRPSCVSPSLVNLIVVIMLKIMLPETDAITFRITLIAMTQNITS